MSPTEIAGVTLGGVSIAGLIASAVAGLAFKRGKLAQRLFAVAFLIGSLGWCLRDAADIEARRQKAGAWLTEAREVADEAVGLLANSTNPADAELRRRSAAVAHAAIADLAEEASPGSIWYRGPDRLAWFSLGFALASALVSWSGAALSASRREATPPAAGQGAN